MSKRRFELDTLILSIFFIVAMPFVAIGAYVVVGMAESALRDAVGGGLRQRARAARLHLERYVGDQQSVLGLVASDPAVYQALWGGSPELTEPEQERLSTDWAAGDAELLQGIVGSRLADRLRRVSDVRPTIRLMQVVDARGVLIASSARAGSALYSQHDWFRALSSELSQRVWVGDVERRHDSAVALYGIAWAVLDGDGVFLGAIRAMIDATDLDAVLSPVRVGETGHAVLIRARDGLVLAGEEGGRVLEDRVAGFSQIQAALSEDRSYWQVTEQTGVGEDGTERLIAPARIVGFSRVSQVPGVDWMVLVEQDAAEALSPVHNVRLYLWLHFVGAFATAILLGLFFSFSLEKPVIEERLHLHEEHVPRGTTAATAD